MIATLPCSCSKGLSRVPWAVSCSNGRNGSTVPRINVSHASNISNSRVRLLTMLSRLASPPTFQHPMRTRWLYWRLIPGHISVIAWRVACRFRRSEIPTHNVQNFGLIRGAIGSRSAWALLYHQWSTFCSNFSGHQCPFFCFPVFVSLRTESACPCVPTIFSVRWLMSECLSWVSFDWTCTAVRTTYWEFWPCCDPCRKQRCWGSSFVAPGQSPFISFRAMQIQLRHIWEYGVRPWRS